MRIGFHHFVGYECKYSWNTVFKVGTGIPGFYLGLLVTFLGEENSIDTALRNVIQKAELFIIFINVKHVRKVGAEKSWGIPFYEEEIRAPSEHYEKMI